MHRFMIPALLLGLSACVAEVDTPDEPDEAQPAFDEAAEAAPAADEGGADAVCGTTWECYCAQFKTASTCQSAPLMNCFWYNKRCQPTYE